LRRCGTRSVATGGGTVKRLTPWAAVAVAAILVSGCSAAQPHDAKTPTATVSTPSPSPTRAAGDLGDVVCFEQVTDTYGEYCHTTIAPDADALFPDESLIDFDALDYFGFTEDDIADALPIALRDLTEDVLDPSTLDNSTISIRAAYKKDSVLSSAEFRERVLPTLKDYSDPWNLGISASYTVGEGLKRTGSARAARGTTITLNGITAGAEDEMGGEPSLVFDLSATAEFPASDVDLVAAYIYFDSSRRKGQLRDSDPQLFDGTNDSVALLVADGVVGFHRGEYTKVSNHSFDMNFTTEAGTSYLRPRPETTES